MCTEASVLHGHVNLTLFKTSELSYLKNQYLSRYFRGQSCKVTFRDM